ncbi:MAG: LuxR C-terminal-related transcriptional regulator, partial [Thermomicrobiales bacterium]
AAPWQGRTETELANLRLAITWFRDRDQIEEAMGMVARLQWFWTIPRYVGEGRQLCHDLLERMTNEVDPLTLANVLDTAVTLALWHTDADAAMKHYLGALAIWRKENTSDKLASALVGLGSASIDALDFQGAKTWLHEAFAIATSRHDMWAAGGSANLLGAAEAARGEHPLAITQHETALRLFNQGGYGAHSRGALNGLALAYLGMGELQRAWENYEAVLSLCSVEDLYSLIPTAIDGFAEIALRTRQNDLAVQLFGIAAAQRNQLALPTRPHMAARSDLLIVESRSAVGNARFTLLWTRAQSLSITESFDLARSVQTPAPQVQNGLTRREHEVLLLLVEGTADNEIADQLFISRRTASKHVASILDKLGAPNRTAAATIAFRRGLMSSA